MNNNKIQFSKFITFHSINFLKIANSKSQALITYI